MLQKFLTLNAIQERQTDLRKGDVTSARVASHAQQQEEQQQQRQQLQHQLHAAADPKNPTATGAFFPANVDSTSSSANAMNFFRRREDKPPPSGLNPHPPPHPPNPPQPSHYLPSQPGASHGQMPPTGFSDYAHVNVQQPGQMAQNPMAQHSMAQNPMAQHSMAQQDAGFTSQNMQQYGAINGYSQSAFPTMNGNATGNAADYFQQHQQMQYQQQQYQQQQQQQQQQPQQSSSGKLKGLSSMFSAINLKAPFHALKTGWFVLFVF